MTEAMAKPGLTIPAITILIIIPLVYTALTIFGNDIICLQSGETIEAEKAWNIDNTVFYISGGQINMMTSNRVKQIISGNYNITNVPALLKYHFTNKKKNALYLLAWMAIAVILYAIFLLTTGRKKLPKRKAAALSKDGTRLPDFPAGNTLEFDFGIDVVKFFLGIFKYQLGAPASAPAYITSREKKKDDRNYTYNLHVKHNDTWQIRRMTIGPIGEKTSSRSKCYYVIYDTHMVIKVPPAPVVDFNKYIENIRREKQVAEKIAPRECLTPRITNILSHIHKLVDEADLTAEQLEQNYVYLVEQKEELKQFLRFGGSYVYFMNLSKYYFLGPIIEAMHDRQTDTTREIKNNPEILWNAYEFDSRYGIDAQPVRHNIMEIYTIFQNRLHELQQAHGLDAEAIRYRRRDWFLNALAGNSINNIAKEFPAAFRDALDRLMCDMIEENAEPVQIYRKLIGDYVTKLALVRNQPKMAGIITNLLDLLAWIGGKGVAIRDLKPDNLLAAGDPNKFPIFLNSAGNYNIGLIDLETTVDFKPGAFKQIEQPLLGGSLFYATPSHFLPNRILKKYFSNPSRIFYLQDWYAGLAIIYELVTGEYLFRQSARFLRNNVRTIKQTEDKSKAMSAFFKQAQGFWRTAGKEIITGCQKHAGPLSTVNAVIPEEFSDWLSRELETTISELNYLITDKIHAQSAFKLEQKQQLLKFSLAQTEKLLNNLQNNQLYPNISLKKYRQATNFLAGLVQERRSEAHANQYLESVTNPAETLTALNLIQMMFLVVKYGMRMRFS